MPKFQTPPDWWVSLANLTDWFEWDAIAAVGTLAAAFWAIHTWRSGQKDGRRRDAAVITAAVQPIAVTAKVLDLLFMHLQSGRPENASVQMVVAPGALHNQRAAMANVQSVHLPSAFAIDVVSAGLSVIDSAIGFADEYLASEKPEVRAALIKALAETRRCATAYAWVLEREARLVSEGRSHTMGAMTVESIEALFAREVGSSKSS